TDELVGRRDTDHAVADRPRQGLLLTGGRLQRRREAFQQADDPGRVALRVDAAPVRRHGRDETTSAPPARTPRGGGPPGRITVAAASSTGPAPVRITVAAASSAGPAPPGSEPPAAARPALVGPSAPTPRPDLPSASSRPSPTTARSRPPGPTAGDLRAWRGRRSAPRPA